MVLSPLAVMLLAQLGLVMFVVILFQKLQKIRLIKELEGLKASKAPFFANTHLDAEEGFDRQQAELLLNRILQNSLSIISEAPAAKVLSEEQQKLLFTLADCIDVPLESAKKNAPINPALSESDDIISQHDLDSALGREEAIEEFDMMDLDDLETSDDAMDDDLDLAVDEYELPEDSVQVALDRIGDFDMDDFEDELQKIDD